jgi:hypothetical protein
MEYKDFKMHRHGCDGVIWGVAFTPFWQTVTILTGRLNEWAHNKARKTATYMLIKGGIDDNPSS